MKRLLAVAATLLFATSATAQTVKQSRVDGNRSGAVVSVPAVKVTAPPTVMAALLLPSVVEVEA